MLEDLGQPRATFPSSALVAHPSVLVPGRGCKFKSYSDSVGEAHQSGGKQGGTREQ